MLCSTPTLLAYAAKARLSLGKQGPPNPNPNPRYLLPILLSDPIAFNTVPISRYILDNAKTSPIILA